MGALPRQAACLLALMYPLLLSQLETTNAESQEGDRLTDGTQPLLSQTDKVEDKQIILVPVCKRCLETFCKNREAALPASSRYCCQRFVQENIDNEVQCSRFKALGAAVVETCFKHKSDWNICTNLVLDDQCKGCEDWFHPTTNIWSPGTCLKAPNMDAEGFATIGATTGTGYSRYIGTNSGTHIGRPAHEYGHFGVCLRPNGDEVTYETLTAEGAGCNDFTVEREEQCVGYFYSGSAGTIAREWTLYETTCTRNDAANNWAPVQSEVACQSGTCLSRAGTVITDVALRLAGGGCNDETILYEEGCFGEFKAESVDADDAAGVTSARAWTPFQQACATNNSRNTWGPVPPKGCYNLDFTLAPTYRQASELACLTGSCTRRDASAGGAADGTGADIGKSSGVTDKISCLLEDATNIWIPSLHVWKPPRIWHRYQCVAENAGPLEVGTREGQSLVLDDERGNSISVREQCEGIDLESLIVPIQGHGRIQRPIPTMRDNRTAEIEVTWLKNAEGVSQNEFGNTKHGEFRQIHVGNYTMPPYIEKQLKLVGHSPSFDVTKFSARCGSNRMCQVQLSQLDLRLRECTDYENCVQTYVSMLDVAEEFNRQYGLSYVWD